MYPSFTWILLSPVTSARRQQDPPRRTVEVTNLGITERGAARGANPAETPDTRTDRGVGHHARSVVDVVVIGGGPAGMSAALVLGRVRRSVVVVHSEQPRNRVTTESHGFLTRDGIAAGEFRAITREPIAAYPSVQFQQDTVTDITGENGPFTTHTQLGTAIRSRMVLFAIGMKDVLPDIDGLKAAYGRSAFVCPYCDGWELRDQPLVLIARASGHIIWRGRLAAGAATSQFAATDRLTSLTASALN